MAIVSNIFVDVIHCILARLVRFIYVQIIAVILNMLVLLLLFLYYYIYFLLSLFLYYYFYVIIFIIIILVFALDNFGTFRLGAANKHGRCEMIAGHVQRTAGCTCNPGFTGHSCSLADLASDAS